MMRFFQRLGKSLMLPVACLPIGGILMGIGYAIDPSGWGANSLLALLLIKAGGILIDNMAILFALGVAIGMSKDQEGTSALAAVISWLTVQTMLGTSVVQLIIGADAVVPDAFGKINTQFIGILCGLIAAGILMSAALCSFFTGVTEPLEFSFMFLAPVLYVIHALLTGISVAIVAALPIRAVFQFSAGFVDWALSFNAPFAETPLLLIPIGLVFFVVYYVIFRIVIVALNLKTPGREDDNNETELSIELSSNDFAAMAQAILEGVGGAANVTSVDNCITRLRLEVKDRLLVDEKKIKASGAAGVVRPGKTSVQVIIGPKVQFVADEFKKLVR